MLPHTIEQLERVRLSCRALVKRRAIMLGGIAVVPVPGLDLMADVAALGNVIPKINQRFGLTAHQIEQLDASKRNTVHEMARKIGADFVGKSVTRRLIVAALARLGKRAIAKRVVKFVPIAGQTLAAAWSYSTMMMIGNAHVEACYQIARAAIQSRQPGAPEAGKSGVAHAAE